MTAFPDPLRLQALSPEQLREQRLKGQHYVTTRTFRYRSDLFGEIVVPAGFLTDFASVPGAVKMYVDDDSPAILFASVIHDFLYSTGGRGGPRGRLLSRLEADQVLREGMRALGARADQVAVVFAAVRIAGASHWVPSSSVDSAGLAV